jgi:hypothetical protein
VLVLLPDVEEMRRLRGTQALGEIDRGHSHPERMSEGAETATGATGEATIIGMPDRAAGLRATWRCP